MDENSCETVDKVAMRGNTAVAKSPNDSAGKPVAGLQREKQFLFFTVTELAEKRTELPVNNYVRTVGLWDQNVPYLSECCSAKGPRVHVDFKSTGTFPESGSTVEAFGRVEFERRDKAPTLVVWFFRQIYGNVSSYVDVCSKLRSKTDDQK